MIARSCLCVFILCCADSAFAQGATRSQRFEVAGFGGGNWAVGSITEATGLRLDETPNLRVDEGSSFKWLVGAGIGVKISDRVMAVGEVALNRLASPTFTATIGGQTLDATVRVSLLEVTGGLHVALGPLDRAVEPYVGGAVGLARVTASATGSTFPSSVSTSVNDVMLNVGGGVRVRISPNSGIRPELKVVHVPDQTFARASAAFFYRF